MRPITIVKRFLKGETPSIPIPPGIEDEVVSNPSTASWLLISQSPTRQRSNPITSTKEAECQTMSALQPFYSRPRACIKRSLGLSGDTPRPAPSFLPRSKVPKLNVGGLQPPKLHCFATSMLSSPTSFRKILLHYSQRPTKTFLNQKELVLNLRDIFYEIQFPSKLFCEIHNAEFLDQRTNRIADSLSTGGLMAYLQIWNHWACWCQCHHQIPAEAPLSLLLDYLHASDHLKRRKDSGEYGPSTLNGFRFSQISDPNPIWTFWSNTNPTCWLSSLGAENSISTIIVVGGHHARLFPRCHNGITPLGPTEKQTWIT